MTWEAVIALGTYLTSIIGGAAWFIVSHFWKIDVRLTSIASQVEVNRVGIAKNSDTPERLAKIEERIRLDEKGRNRNYAQRQQSAHTLLPVKT